MSFSKDRSAMVVFGWWVAVSVLGHRVAWGDWQEHRIRQGDGQGGWVTRPARRQALKHPDANHTMPFGLVQMDNREIALRNDMPPQYFESPHDDSLEGTSISISRDNGKTWSEMQFLFHAGRHHANLQRLPNGDLVCTLVVRDDIQNGKLVSHRRGCDALEAYARVARDQSDRGALATMAEYVYRPLQDKVAALEKKL